MKYVKIITLFSTLAVLLSGGGAAMATTTDPGGIRPENSSPVFRIYNPNSGEHFYTTSISEMNELVVRSWVVENIGWFAPDSGSPVYRLYNSNAGDHYYTQSSSERDYLASLGWKAEGIAFYSGGDTDVYVAYNPNAKAGAHNYTVDNSEQKSLLSIGWKYGMPAWKAAAAGIAFQYDRPLTL